MTASLPALVQVIEDNTPPALSAEEVQRRASQGRHDARGTTAANTARTYKVGVRAFEAWCQAQDVAPGFPVPPRLIAAFLDDLSERLAPATLNTYLHAINEMHRRLDLPVPGSANVVRLAMKLARRAAADKGHEPKQARAMRRSHIEAAIRRMGDSLTDLRDAALVSLAYDTLCRASELVALNVRDVRQEGRDASAYIGRSKTDQEGKGQFRFVASDTFARVRAWVEARGLDDGDALFPSLGRGGRAQRLTRRDVARIYKDRVGEEFSAHSTRVGAAVEQREAGVPTGLIAQAGGWKGDAMPAHYTRHLDARESGAAILARRQGRVL